MLQEVLLSLSGHGSPLWKQLKDDPSQSDDPESLPNYLAPSENALLAPLANLSNLHIKLRDHTAQVASSHSSVICRAVASAISSNNLKRFRQKILEVEASILTKDAAYVGGYDIVPLSTVVSEFAPWTRRLEWLWEVATFLRPSSTNSHPSKAKCTGAAIINFLENETYTGYSDLEKMAAGLLEVAERAWMRQIATWVLYGKLPSHGADDFFIQRGSANPAAKPDMYSYDMDLAPALVSPAVAASMLSIGESLNQIRSQTSAAMSTSGTDPAMALLPSNLSLLNTLSYPLASSMFANTISSIRFSISQNALSQLLPLPKVLEILNVIQQFLLLGRGEFASSLVKHANLQIASRHRSQDPTKPVRKAGRLDDMSIKDVEAATVLAHAFSELASLRNNDDLDDGLLEMAMSLLRLAVLHDVDETSTNTFLSTLLPIPTSLDLSLPSDSPLNLFLSLSELQTYSSINSYLLSIRRAELHLSALWKITPLRRCHPCPLGPPRSATLIGRKRLAAQRSREAQRSSNLRKHWASAGKTLFVLNELGAYLQGEVIRGHWDHFCGWIDHSHHNAGRPSSAGSRGSRPGTASSSAAAARQLRTTRPSNSTKPLESTERPPATNDPVALAQAHRLYLRGLTNALLLNNIEFIKALRSVLLLVDHFVALFERLRIAWDGLDLQEDEGVMDALSNHEKEEKEVLEEMGRSRTVLEEGLSGLVEKVGTVETAKEGDSVQELYDGIGGIEFDSLSSDFVPWRARTIDRLIMKLDLLDGGVKETDDGKENYHDDE